MKTENIEPILRNHANAKRDALIVILQEVREVEGRLGREFYAKAAPTRMVTTFTEGRDSELEHDKA